MESSQGVGENVVHNEKGAGAGALSRVTQLTAGIDSVLESGFPNSQLSHPTPGMIVITHSLPPVALASSGLGRLWSSGQTPALFNLSSQDRKHSYSTNIRPARHTAVL